MSSLFRVVFFALVLGAAPLVVRWTTQSSANPQDPPQDPEATRDSVARYAVDDFVAACRVRPANLANHPYFGSLPIHSFLPDPVSLGRLEAMDVEELVVFCGPPTARTPDAREDGHSADLEWAAAARLSNPVDLETAMRQWRQSLVPRDEPAAGPRAITIAGHECFQVPAGSFFPPPRTYGELRFTDRDGEPSEHGINVGNIYEYRGYVEGGTQAAAIFSLDGIDAADIVDGQLTLELRPDVFLTRHLDHEYSTAQIELRNPATGLRSEPISFVPRSYVNRRLPVPRTLMCRDADGRKQADLLDDLVSRGRLEVIVQATEPSVYLGVGWHDLNVLPRASEYVFVSGREIVLARSPALLASMLESAGTPNSLADRLAQPTSDVLVVANVRNETERRVLRQVVRMMTNSPDAAVWAAALTDLRATLDMSGNTTARLSAEFHNRESAGRAGQTIQSLIRSTKAAARADIGDAILRVDAHASLVSYGFDGIPMRFVDPTSETGRSREPQLLSAIDDALNSIDVKTDDKRLTVEFRQPASLSRLSEAARFGLANVETALARGLFAQERFDLGDEVLERITTRLPHLPQAWYRRAHQLSYNMSFEFDGYSARYAWIRHGLNALIDGAEQNPDAIDLLRVTARFIAHKIGESDERAAYRRLFSEDQDLHQRISRFIDLKAARSPDQAVDNWLVARLLYEHCLERQRKLDAPSTIPPLFLFSRPATAQAQYAHALTEAAHWEQALEAWKVAETMLAELGETRFVGEHRARLNDLENRLARSGPDDPSVKELRLARRLIDYDYWLARCRLEQSAEVQRARKLAQRAAEHDRLSESEPAQNLYRQALEALADVYQKHPAEFELCAGDFRDVASGYRNLVGPAADADDQPIASVEAVIEQAPRYRTPFLFEALQDKESLDVLRGLGIHP